MTKTMICAIAGIALAYALGFQRGVAAGALKPTAPIVGGGIDFLNWQAQ